MNARQFYGKQQPVAPALRGGKGYEAALRAARSDPKFRVRQFPTQEQAFSFSDAHPHLRLHAWSYEVDGKGKRRFLVASYPSFWGLYRRWVRRGQQMHFYEIIRNGTACKLYFDLEFFRAVNPTVDTEKMLLILKTAVADLCSPGDASRVIELDSTTEKKWSKHLIFPAICFHDNIQAGEFAQKVCDEIESNHGGALMVKSSDDGTVPFVDMAVYTKNRCFRLVASSKFGKSSRLLPTGHGKNERLSISESLFFDSLVCNVSANASIRGSPRPMRTNSFTRRTYVSGSAEGGQRFQAGESDDKSGFQLLDQYILSIVSPHNGSIYGISHFRGSGTLQYTIRGGYKYCARVGRHHKSNNVILIADIPTRKMYQKCFDPDCRDFCSDPWEIPAAVLESDNVSGPTVNSAMSAEDVPDEVLYGMMDEVEAARNEISDDALNAMMDCVETYLLTQDEE